MSQFRFSISALMQLVVVVALGIAALRYASPFWAGAVFLLTCAVHGVSVVGSLCAARSERPVFLGRALFGLGYLGLFLWLSCDDSGVVALPTQPGLEFLREKFKQQHSHAQLNSVGFRTAELKFDFREPLRDLPETPDDSLGREPFSARPVQFSGMGCFSCMRPDPSEPSFYKIGHCLWSLLAAVFGGVLARECFCYANTDARDAEPAPAVTPTSRQRKRWPAIAARLGGLSILACGVAAVRRTSDLCADAVVLGTFGLLGLAVLGACQATGPSRRACLGAGLFGWGYLLLAFATPVFRDAQGESVLPGFVTRPDVHDLRTRVPFLSSLLPGSSDNDPANAAIFAALNRRLDALLPKEEIPLEDLLASLRSATTSAALPNGVPFYVDPVGLQEAEKTMTSPVTFGLQPGDVSVRTGLHLMLKQFELDFFVTGGTVVITHLGERNFERTIFSGYQRMGHCLVALIAAAVGWGAAWLMNAASKRS